MKKREGLVYLVLNRVWLSLSKVFGREAITDSRLKDNVASALKEPFPMLSAAALSFDRISRYRDYEDMDANSAYISTALDIYSSDCTQFDAFVNATVWVKSEDKEIAKILNRFLQETMEIEEVAATECRNIAKYGSIKNFYLIKEGKGIVKVYPIIDDIYVLRIEDSTGRLLGYKRDPSSSAAIMPSSIMATTLSSDAFDFKYYEIGHARIRERPYLKTVNNQPTGVLNDFAVEGYSLIENARRPVRDYELLKEAVMVYRITHSIDRLEHKIDLSGKAPDEGLDYMNRYMNALKRREYVDQTTKRVSLMPNLPSFMEDLFTPVWKDSLTSSTLLKITGDVSSIEDLKLLQEEIEGALKFPPGFLFRNDGASIQFNRPLSYDNIILARHIDKLQKAYRQYIHKTCLTHLILSGKDVTPNQFMVLMSPVSHAIDLQKMEVLSSLINNAGQLLPLAENLGVDKTLWNKYVFRLTLGRIDFGEVIDSIGHYQAQQATNLVLKVKEQVMDRDKEFEKRFPSHAKYLLESYRKFMDSKEFDEFAEQIQNFVEQYISNPYHEAYQSYHRIMNRDVYDTFYRLKSIRSTSIDNSSSIKRVNPFLEDSL